jgi:hypothetical protein
MAQALTNDTYNGRTVHPSATDAAELLARIAQLEAALQAKETTAKLTLKVGEKGGVSLYGLGRWPVTLYKSQWLRLLVHADTIRQFISDNDGRLSEKA